MNMVSKVHCFSNLNDVNLESFLIYTGKCLFPVCIKRKGRTTASSKLLFNSHLTIYYDILTHNINIYYNEMYQHCI